MDNEQWESVYEIYRKFTFFTMKFTPQNWNFLGACITQSDAGVILAD